MHEYFTKSYITRTMAFYFISKWMVKLYIRKALGSVCPSNWLETRQYVKWITKTDGICSNCCEQIAIERKRYQIRQPFRSAHTMCYATRKMQINVESVTLRYSNCITAKTLSWPTWYKQSGIPVRRNVLDMWYHRMLPYLLLCLLVSTCVYWSHVGRILVPYLRIITEIKIPINEHL